MRNFQGYYDRRELDNHITGHYGEDQFRRDNSPAERSFAAGVEARAQGKSITVCRAKSSERRKDWEMGWRDQDSAMLAEQQNPDLNPGARDV